MLFVNLYASSLLYYPLLLAMAATTPASLLQPLSSLAHVDFTLARHQLWASAREFRQRNIRLSVVTKSKNDLNKGALQPVLRLLQANTSDHICVVVNFQSNVSKVAQSIENRLAEAGVRTGILVINGNTDKN